MRVEKVKSLVDIVDLLEEYGFDIPSGKNRPKVRCVFHNDRNPSAQVDLSKQRFKCYVCDVQGDIVDIVMTVERLDFREALEWLERRFRL